MGTKCLHKWSMRSRSVCSHSLMLFVTIHSGGFVINDYWSPATRLLLQTLSNKRRRGEVGVGLIKGFVEKVY